MTGQLPLVKTASGNGNGRRARPGRSRRPRRTWSSSSRRSPSRARSSTPRPATSGSRPARTCNAAHELGGATRCRRSRPTASGSTSSGRPRAAASSPRAAAGSGPGTTSNDPSLMRIKPDGSAAERLLTGRFQQGGNTWFSWMREPAPSPDGRRRAHLATAPEPAPERRRPPALRPRQPKKLTTPEPAENPAARPPGRGLAARRQGRCSTSGTGATARRGAPADLPLRPGHEEDLGAHRARATSPRRSRRTGSTSPRPEDDRSAPTS